MPAKGYAKPDDERRIYRLFISLSDFELAHLDRQLPGEHSRERAPYIRGLILRDIPLAPVPPDYHKHVDENRAHKIEILLNVFELATIIAGTMVSVVKETMSINGTIVLTDRSSEDLARCEWRLVQMLWTAKGRSGRLK